VSLLPGRPRTARERAAADVRPNYEIQSGT
jgi:hypothetical protein